MRLDRLALGLLAASVLFLWTAPVRADEAADDDPEAAAKVLIEQMHAEEAGDRFDAAKAAVGNADGSLTSPLIKLLRDDSAEVRFAALEALATRAGSSDRRKAADAIAGRLPRLEKSAANREEVLASIAALQTLAQKGPIKDLIKGIKNDSDPEIVRATLVAIAHVPDVEAVDRLIQFLSKGRRGGLKAQRQAAVEALRIATGQRLGNDPDKWRAWWKDARDGFDFDAVAQTRDAAKARAEERDARREARKDKKRDKGDGKGKRRKPDDAADDA